MSEYVVTLLKTNNEEDTYEVISRIYFKWKKQDTTMQPLVKKRRRDMDIYMYIQIYHINTSNWKKKKPLEEKKSNKLPIPVEKGKEDIRGGRVRSEAYQYTALYELISRWNDRNRKTSLYNLWWNNCVLQGLSLTAITMRWRLMWNITLKRSGYHQLYFNLSSMEKGITPIWSTYPSSSLTFKTEPESKQASGWLPAYRK